MVAISKEQHPLRMSETEYLEFEDNQEEKHEFIGGEIVAMTGASVRHNVICNNISATLITQLGDKDCLVPNNDTRVKVESVVSYRYPDVTVICGKIQYVNNRTDTISNPIVLVEVLSPSTTLTDREQKLSEYTRIDSLQEYVIVSQHERKIERYLRQDTGWLYNSVTDSDTAMRLESIDCDLSLDVVYRKIELTEVDEESNSE